ncbi:hypothetical protein DFS33DRAFT_1289041 [Desarmillaria ectypa]|nr:hypothetical protein DFS33DRAFT_1289041 [Desarmillaria ectypa]
MFVFSIHIVYCVRLWMLGRFFHRVIPCFITVIVIGICCRFSLNDPILVNGSYPRRYQPPQSFSAEKYKEFEIVDGFFLKFLLLGAKYTISYITEIDKISRWSHYSSNGGHNYGSCDILLPSQGANSYGFLQYEHQTLCLDAVDPHFRTRYKCTGHSFSDHVSCLSQNAHLHGNRNRFIQTSASFLT